VRRLLEQPQAKKPQDARPDPDINRLQETLSERLGTRVEIQHSNKGSGKVTLKYNSLDELDGILSHIK